jgi:hypothetical protein
VPGEKNSQLEELKGSWSTEKERRNGIRWVREKVGRSEF